ncbi:MAG: serine hydrolase domain-containing protein [Candidatus Acidiferrales bacterium]
MNSILRFFLVLSLALAPAFCQKPAIKNWPVELSPVVDPLVKQILDSSGVPSASLAITRDGQIAYERAYGYAQLNPPILATPEMRYEIGSNSKQFTAAAVLLLEQDGKLSLDDPVSKYLPSLTRANEVTLRMLLSHTSGYQDYSPENYMIPANFDPITPAEILDTWAKKALDFDPGTQWQYSNTNYAIAARIIEQVTEEPYIRFIQKRIFTPLAMKSAVDADTGRFVEGGARGYYRHALGPLRPAPREGRGWMYGAFALGMTAHDLALWDISLVKRSLLKPASYQQMFTSIRLKDGTDTHYALGLATNPIAGHAALEHGGETSGFTSENIVIPAEGISVSVLTNQDASNGASQIAQQIASLLLSGQGADAVRAEAQSLALFASFQQGKIDRSLFTPSCNAYFSQEALDDYASSLKPLGAPSSFYLVSEAHRGGMIYRAFNAEFSGTGRRLKITTLAMPDGKLQQYLVEPVE